MSIDYDGVQVAEPQIHDEDAERVDLIIARQILAEVLEVIALSTSDRQVQELAIGALGLDRLYDGVLAEVARPNGYCAESLPVREDARSSRGPVVCGPALWVRSEDVECD